MYNEGTFKILNHFKIVKYLLLDTCNSETLTLLKNYPL